MFTEDLYQSTSLINIFSIKSKLTPVVFNLLYESFINFSLSFSDLNCPYVSYVL